MNAPLPEHIRKALETVTLDDKYSLDYGRAFMSGVQALVKLPMLQRLRDQQQGKNTAGFISGYRGSPLGGYDQALWKASKYLKEQNIVFQPGVNEELAATALWGTQQLGFSPAGTTGAITNTSVTNSPGPTDAWITVKEIPIIGNIRIGSQKEWFSLEHLNSFRSLEFM